MFRHYQRQARLRSVAWRLTRDEFRLLVTAPCVYCGAEPETRFYPRFSKRLGRSERVESEESLNGVDRIDSRQGYTAENCASACWKCNRIKGQMSMSEMLEHIAKMLERVRGS